jgi:type I restriction enzyme S subunit
MIAGLKPYPYYRDSAIPWLSKIPEGWLIEPGFAVYREKQQKNVGMAEKRVLSLSYGRIIIKPGDRLHGLVPESFETYQIVEPGDIIIRSTDLQNDWTSLRVGLVRDRGIITSAYLCLKMVGPLVAEYGYLQLHALDLMKVFYGMGSGLRQNLDFSDFKRMPVLVPPREEQDAIVRFLDHVNRRIERYIRAKQKLIKLLEEQKQSIIHRAVFRGLDPNIRVKPSGVEWLGNVPEHWEVTRLKFVARHIVDCLHATPIYAEDGGYPAIRTADVQPGRLLLESARRVDEDHYLRWTARLTPEEGDILYTREGERFGIAALVPANVRLCISQRMMLFRIHPIHNSAYVMWQINCQHVYAQAAADLIGAAAPHVNVERIKNLWLILPSRSEQDAIVGAVEAAHVGPNNAIARACDEIALLREYRTRLIADVVTGKLDVREAAARLPDQIEESEGLDEAEAETELEDMGDEPDAAAEEAEA